MAKDRTRHARMRGKALEDRRYAERVAMTRRTMRTVRRSVEAFAEAMRSLTDAMSRGVDYIDWLLRLDGAE